MTEGSRITPLTPEIENEMERDINETLERDSKQLQEIVSRYQSGAIGLSLWKVIKGLDSESQKELAKSLETVARMQGG